VHFVVIFFLTPSDGLIQRNPTTTTYILARKIEYEMKEIEIEKRNIMCTHKEEPE
jgi:hypothetical protein